MDVAFLGKQLKIDDAIINYIKNGGSIPCTTLHPGNTCFQYFLYKVKSIAPGIAKVYAIIYIMPVILFKRKQLQ